MTIPDLTVLHVEPVFRDLMLAYQPFSRANVEAVERLATLKALYLTDKHRTIHTVVGSMLAEPAPKIVTQDLDVLRTVPRSPVLKPGAVVATLVVAPESIAETSDFDVSEIPVEVRFGDGEDVTYRDLVAIHDTVAQVVSEFSTLFAH